MFFDHSKIPAVYVSPPLTSILPGKWVTCDVIDVFIKYWFGTGPVDTCGKYFVFDSMLSNHLDKDAVHFDPVPLLHSPVY